MFASCAVVGLKRLLQLLPDQIDWLSAAGSKIISQDHRAPDEMKDRVMYVALSQS